MSPVHLRRMAATLSVAVVVLASACDQGSASAPDKAAHIVGLIEVRGDSPVALDDYNNGVQLAVGEINAAGGVLGKPLKYTRIPASVTDPQAARTAFLRAVDLDPSAMVGFPGGGSLEALNRDVESAARPMIHLSSDGKLARGAESGSEWLFSVNPDDTARAINGVALARKLGAKRIGILATDETFGRVSAENSLKAIKDAGLKVGAVRYVPPTATDLTGPLLDLRESDVILSWTFPNVLALQMNQMQQNGMDAPVISGNSGPLVVANKLATGAAVENLYAVTPCAPALGSAREGREFAAEYRKKHETTPTASATQAYDAVRILAAAMERAKTTSDHAKIAQALRDQEWRDGACAAVYQSDGAQFLGHQMVAESYKAPGSIVETYQVPPVNERSAG